jgi:hypothetical protein
MVRLSEQLKYLIAKKVSEDADWRNVEIILSGHEVSDLLVAGELGLMLELAGPGRRRTQDYGVHSSPEGSA